MNRRRQRHDVLQGVRERSEHVHTLDQLQFGKLLLVDQATAGVDDVVRLLEVEHGVFCRRRLLPQLLYSFLKPGARPACRFIFRLELIDDIGVRRRIRDLGGALRVQRQKSDLNDVCGPDAPRGESLREKLRAFRDEQTNKVMSDEL